tara:strand:+ start:90 stop:203 length:114 start_codon:yes stop_codon:yes gene_type:complete
MHTAIPIVFALFSFGLAVVLSRELIEEFMLAYKSKIG